MSRNSEHSGPEWREAACGQSMGKAPRRGPWARVSFGQQGPGHLRLRGPEEVRGAPKHPTGGAQMEVGVSEHGQEEVRLPLPSARAAE